MKKIVRIEGMSCNHCSMAVEKALKKLDGVTDATVDLEGKTATIDMSDFVLDDILIKAVEDAGYKVIEIQ
jgi:Cu+-exporting ATPase